MTLKTVVGGLTLRNPVMPASGPIVGDLEKLHLLQKEGVGALVTKTISSKKANVPRPCIIAGKNFLLNSELWSEFSVDYWLEQVFPQLREELIVPLIISVGYTPKDMELLIPKLKAFADAFEISTHYTGDDPSFVSEILKTVRKHTSKPVFLKMSPHMRDPIGFALLARDYGANGLVVSNSVGPALAVNLEERRIVLGNKEGFSWLSGPAMKPLSLALVYKISSSVEDLDIIGVGGIENCRDVLEYLLAGAKAVQVLSSSLIHGRHIFSRIINDLPDVLKSNGFASVEEVLKTKLEWSISYTKSVPTVDETKCTLCGTCERVCPYLAVKVTSKVSINEDKCFGCGLCQSKCPTKAIGGVL